MSPFFQLPTPSTLLDRTPLCRAHRRETLKGPMGTKVCYPAKMVILQSYSPLVRIHGSFSFRRRRDRAISSAYLSLQACDVLTLSKQSPSRHNHPLDTITSRHNHPLDTITLSPTRPTRPTLPPPPKVSLMLMFTSDQLDFDSHTDHSHNRLLDI